MKRLIVVAIGLLLAGCGSAPSQKISGIGEIVGDWTGTSYYKGGSVPVSLKITPDGAFTSVTPQATSTGKVAIDPQGRVIWTGDATGRTGEWTFEGQGADLTLISQNTLATADGQNIRYESRLKRK